jgi:hypothetical protein
MGFYAKSIPNTSESDNSLNNLIDVADPVKRIFTCIHHCKLTKIIFQIELRHFLKI